MPEIYTFNNNKHNWKINASEITSISGDDLKIYAKNNQNIVFKTSGAVNIENHLDILNNLRSQKDINIVKDLILDTSNVSIKTPNSNYVIKCGEDLLTKYIEFSNQWIDLSDSGYKIDVTPETKNSKILLNFNVTYNVSEINNQKLSFRLKRFKSSTGQTDIVVTDNMLGTEFAFGVQDIFKFVYLDEPSIDTSITYYLEVNCNKLGSDLSDVAILGYNDNKYNNIIAYQIYIPDISNSITKAPKKSISVSFEDIINNKGLFNNIDASKVSIDNYLNITGTTSINNIIDISSYIYSKSGTIEISGNISTKDDKIYDLGSSDKKFKHVFLSTESLYFRDKKVSIDVCGNMKISDNSSNENLYINFDSLISDASFGNIELSDNLIMSNNTNINFLSNIDLSVNEQLNILNDISINTTLISSGNNIDTIVYNNDLSINNINSNNLIINVSNIDISSIVTHDFINKNDISFNTVTIKQKLDISSLKITDLRNNQTITSEAITNLFTDLSVNTKIDISQGSIILNNNNINISNLKTTNLTSNDSSINNLFSNASLDKANINNLIIKNKLNVKDVSCNEIETSGNFYVNKMELENNKLTIEASNVVIEGSLIVDGTNITIESNNIEISGNKIKLASNDNDNTRLNGSGIEISNNIASIKYKNTNDEIEISSNLFEVLKDISAKNITIENDLNYLGTNLPNITNEIIGTSTDLSLTLSELDNLPGNVLNLSNTDNLEKQKIFNTFDVSNLTNSLNINDISFIKNGDTYTISYNDLSLSDITRIFSTITTTGISLDIIDNKVVLSLPQSLEPNTNIEFSGVTISNSLYISQQDISIARVSDLQTKLQNMKNEGSSSSSSQITSSSKFSVDLNFNNNDNKNKIITYEKNKNKYIKTSDIVVSSENNLHQNMYLYLNPFKATLQQRILNNNNDYSNNSYTNLLYSVDGINWLNNVAGHSNANSELDPLYHSIIKYEKNVWIYFNSISGDTNTDHSIYNFSYDGKYWYTINDTTGLDGLSPSLLYLSDNRSKDKYTDSTFTNKERQTLATGKHVSNIKYPVISSNNDIIVMGFSSSDTLKSNIKLFYSYNAKNWYNATLYTGLVDMSEYKYVGVAPVQRGPWGNGNWLSTVQDGFQVIKNNTNILSTTIERNGFNWYNNNSIRRDYDMTQTITYGNSNLQLINLWDSFQQPHFYGELLTGENLTDATYRLQIRDPAHFFGKGHFVVSKNSSGPWIIVDTYTHPYLDNWSSYTSSWNTSPDFSGSITINSGNIESNAIISNILWDGNKFIANIREDTNIKYGYSYSGKEWYINNDVSMNIGSNALATLQNNRNIDTILSSGRIISKKEYVEGGGASGSSSTCYDKLIYSDDGYNWNEAIIKDKDDNEILDGSYGKIDNVAYNGNILVGTIGSSSSLDSLKKIIYSYTGSEWNMLDKTLLSAKSVPSNLEWTGSMFTMAGRNFAYSYNGLQWFNNKDVISSNIKGNYGTLEYNNMVTQDIKSNINSKSSNNEIRISANQIIGIGQGSKFYYSNDIFNWYNLNGEDTSLNYLTNFKLNNINRNNISSNKVFDVSSGVYDTIIDNKLGLSYNGKMWLACGNTNDLSNTLAYSKDGYNWFNIGNNVSNILTRGYDITNNKKTWVAVGKKGTNGSIIYSNDGFSWCDVSNLSIQNSQQICSVVYGNDMFVAGSKGDKFILYYSRDAKNWTGIDISNIEGNSNIDSNYNSCTNLIYNGTSFVGLLQPENKSETMDKLTIIYSSDGYNWNAIVNTSIIANDSSVNSLYSMDHNKDRVMVVGYRNILYSDNLIDWYRSTKLPYLDVYKRYTDIIWTGELWLLSTNYEINNHKKLYYSKNGKVWNQINNGSVLQDTFIMKIGCTKSQSNIYLQHPIIAGCDGSTNTLIYSDDLYKWKGLGRVFSKECNDIKWNGNNWVAIGKNNLNNSEIKWSKDGIKWTNIIFPNDISGLNSIVCGKDSSLNDIMVIAGNKNNDLIILKSKDNGIKWNTKTVASNIPVTNDLKIIYNNYNYILCADKIYKSSDLNNWESILDSSGRNILTTGNNLLFINNSTNKLTKLDLYNYTNSYSSQEILNTNNVECFGYNGEMFIVVENDNTNINIKSYRDMSSQYISNNDISGEASCIEWTGKKWLIGLANETQFKYYDININANIHKRSEKFICSYDGINWEYLETANTFCSKSIKCIATNPLIGTECYDSQIVINNNLNSNNLEIINNNKLFNSNNVSLSIG